MSGGWAMWDSILDVAMEYLGRQQDRLMADFPLGDWQRYDYGQEAGTLTFSSNGRIGIVADIQVVLDFQEWRHLALGVGQPSASAGRGIRGAVTAAVSDYVHGYTAREAERLGDQARTLAALLHSDTSYPARSLVLEAGCGIGSQTVTLARQSPGATIVSVDISAVSLRAAREQARSARLDGVRFARGDIYAPPFAPATFDHVFVCFVLEHLARPAEALRNLRRVLRPGGTVTVIEGDHGSAYFHPDSPHARRAIQCLVDLQARAGGNALIGRALYPLLIEAGFRDVEVSPRVVYVDSSRPELVEGFTKNTFTAMVDGVRERALAEGLVDEPAWRKGIADLYRTAEADGTFCYTFFKAVAKR